MAVAAIICFANVLSNDFCDDGIPIVAHNDKVNAPGQWLTIWTTDYWLEAKEATPYRDLLYRPVSLTSYRLVRTLTGVRPLPHHVVNILLHAVICVMIVRLCRYLGGSERAAMAAGLVFAVLPIHTAVLNNVVGRADLLATLGAVGALLSHRRLMHSGSTSVRVTWWLIAGLAAFVAMGSKESGVSVILLVPLFDAFWHRDLKSTREKTPWLSVRTLCRVSHLVIPSIVYFALRYHALEGRLYQRPALSKTINVLVDAPFWQHGLGVLQLWGMYWEKTFWPDVLCVNYSINAIRLATGVWDWHVVMGAAVTVVLVVASIQAWRRGVRSVALMSAATVVAYAPTANVAALIQVFFAERIWYLPSVGVALLAGFAAAGLLRRRAWWVVGGLIVLGMTARCWIRNTEWKDNGTLYAAAYRDHPDAIGALYLYGNWLASHGDNAGEVETGIELLRRAIDMDLGFTDGHRALGHAYLRAGEYKKALEHLQIAEMQVPGHPATAATLARLSVALSARDDELARLRQRAEDTPNDVDAEIALLRKLRNLGQAGKALERLGAHEDRFDDNLAWQTEYAVTLVYLNERDAAIERYERCLELDASEPQLLVELAMLLLERRDKGDLDEAWRLAERAAELTPDAPIVLVCRAELLALRGDLDGAVALYRRAIRSLPPDSQQRRNLEARARTLGQ